jgi:accessory gene regulator protein AgrB
LVVFAVFTNLIWIGATIETSFTLVQQEAQRAFFKPSYMGMVESVLYMVKSYTKLDSNYLRSWHSARRGKG